MGKSSNIAFRSALSGYNREDVNRYILDLNRRLEEQAELLERAAAENEQIRAALEEEKGKAQQALRTEKEAREEAERQLASLHEEAVRRRKEAEEDALVRASLEKELDDANKKLEALQKELAVRPSADTSTEKSQKYDQLSAQIGDILINANQSADNILTSAHAQAARIVTETEEEANYIRTRLSDTADEMLTAISAQLHLSTENCVTELMTAVREMRDSADSLVRDLEARSRELDTRIEYYQSNVSENIEKSLSEMDQKYGIRKK